VAPTYFLDEHGKSVEVPDSPGSPILTITDKIISDMDHGPMSAAAKTALVASVLAKTFPKHFNGKWYSLERIRERAQSHYVHGPASRQDRGLLERAFIHALADDLHASGETFEPFSLSFPMIDNYVRPRWHVSVSDGADSQPAKTP